MRKILFNENFSIRMPSTCQAIRRSRSFPHIDRRKEAVPLSQKQRPLRFSWRSNAVRLDAAAAALFDGGFLSCVSFFEFQVWVDNPEILIFRHFHVPKAPFAVSFMQIWTALM
jgi:hypothetical protein